MNIALIGLGMVAGTHVAAINAAATVQLTHVMGRDAARTRAFANAHGVRACTDINDIANDPDIDFAIIATPPDARLELARPLAGAGKPVLMEKPVERTLNAARQVVQMFEDVQLPLGVIFQHRARAASQALKQAVASGVLGDLATLEIRVPWWRDQAYYDAPGRGTYSRDGGGVMLSQAIHTLDLASWLAGPVVALQAMMRTTPLHRLEAEDFAGALLEFRNGACGTLMASTAAFPGGAESVTLQGSKASAHLQSGVLELCHMDGRVENFGTDAATGGGADPMAFTHAWHQTVIEDFAESLRAGRAPMTSGRAALHTHAIIDAMTRASASGTRTTVDQT